MKKILAILFALILLLSGMHFSVATHYCGGKIAEVKFSLSGTHATCGMVRDNDADESQKNTFKSNCCKNIVSVYTVDSNYSPSQSLVLNISKDLLKIFRVPESIITDTSNPSKVLISNASPPDCILASLVALEDICTFRI